MSSVYSTASEEIYYDVERHDILSSRSTNYMVLKTNGEGSFGKVVKCVDLKTKKLVAVKIHKMANDAQNQKEVNILNAVRALDPDKNNIVRFIDSFTSNNLSCLAFEMLDKSLADMMHERKYIPLSHGEIRPLLFQLLEAFKALKSIGIVHTDMKPDNVMLVNQKLQPFKIKIIDFGMATPVTKLKVGETIQATAYRAPEVTLGLPLSEAVDIWGLGCILVYLYFGVHFFKGTCPYHRMKAMVHMLGQPSDDLLSAGQNTWKFFNKQKGSVTPRWRLKLPCEYKEATGYKPKVLWNFFRSAVDFEDAVMSHTVIQDPVELLDKMAFYNLLKACLHMDARHRIMPEKALEHTFITMVHMANSVETSSYAKDALKLMTVFKLDKTDSYTTDPGLELTDGQASRNGGTHHFIDVKTFTKSEQSFASLGEKVTFCSKALKTFSKTDPNSASSSENDSDYKSFSGNKADVESFCDEDLQTDSSSSDEGINIRLTLCSKSELMDGYLKAEVSKHINVAGPSATARNCAAVAINGHRAGSIDGASSAIKTEDVVDVKTKKKRNLLQKASKFFSRVKRRALSLFKPRHSPTITP